MERVYFPLSRRCDLTLTPGTFNGDPTVKAQGHRDFVLIQSPEQPFYYITRAGLYVLPPHGMKTDLGSVPRLPITAWLIPHDSQPASFVTHDWLCYAGIALQPRDGVAEWRLKLAILESIYAETEHERVHSWAGGFYIIRCNRAFADATLNECLQVEGCSRVKRWAIVAACTLWGKFTQRAYRAKRNAELMKEFSL